MVFCSNCGKELINSAKFCPECGTPVSSSYSQRKSVYDGEIHKCPNCGEVLESFTTKCTACGYELRGVKNSNAVREFAMKLEQIERNRIIDNRVVSGLKEKMSKLSSVNPTDEQKISFIRSFAIPNTKEDIYEFMILASSNIDLKLYGMAYDSSQFQGIMTASQRAVSDAWLSKFEQAYQKANLMFGSSQEFLNVQIMYQQKMKEISKKKKQFPIFIVCCFLSLPLCLIFIWLLTAI